MPKFSKKRVTAFIVVVCVGAVLGIKLGVELARGGKPHPGGISRVKGEEQAPVKITEFIDFQCPACAEGAIYLKKFMEENPGLVRLELKYYPLRNHTHGLFSAKYAECAARQGRFWPFVDTLVIRQANWSRLADAKLAFQLIAEEVGLDLPDVDQCLQDKSIEELIVKIKGEGDILGVKSTPTYYINGKMAVGVDSLKIELAPYLKDAQD